MVGVVVLSTLLATLATPATDASTARDWWRTPVVIDCGNAAAWPPRDYACRNIGRQLYQVNDCFEKDLVRRPDLGCRVPVLFSVSGSGSTEASLVLPAEPCPAGAGGEAAPSPRASTAAEKSILGDETIESCVARVARSWQLPAPGVRVVFSYMFVFNIEGGSRDPYPFNFDDMVMSSDGMGRRAPPAGEQALNFAPWVIVRTMNRVQPEVHSCYERLKIAGLAMVRLMVDVAGKVTWASVAGPFAGTPTGACVEKAVKKASFPPSSGGGFVYPFRLP